MTMMDIYKLLILVAFHTNIVVLADSDHKYFNIFHGRQISSAVDTVKANSLYACATRCVEMAQTGSCKLAGYDRSTKTCMVTADSPAVVSYAPDINSVVIEISEICGFPGIPTNGYTEVSADGTTAVFSCGTGYTLSGVATLQCVDSNWIGSLPTCQPVDCSAPPTVDNGTVSYSSTLLGSSATVQCDLGLMAVPSQITCQATATWTNSQCNLIECGMPSIPTNGDNVTFSTWFYGDTATVTCLSGYGPSTTTIKCQSDGSWETSVCKIECGVPFVPLNGFNVTYSSRLQGDIATVTCSSGYAPSTAYITCQSNRTWTTTSCKRECGVPTLPLNGFNVTYSSRLQGDIATVTCSSGYAPFLAFITCQSNGTWTAMTCTRECGVPTLPLNGFNVTYSSRLQGDIATVTCSSGYAPSLAYITCQSNGTWTAMTCTRDCGSNLASSLTGVTVSYQQGTLEGSTAVATCSPGYRSDSGSTAWSYICYNTGIWQATPAADCLWNLMFRSSAGNGFNVTNAFLFGLASDGVTTSDEACKDVYNTSCSLNYRNPTTDNWSLLNISLVSYELYNSTNNVLTLRFNGTGSTKSNWLSVARVISHPWSASGAASAYWNLHDWDTADGRSFRITWNYAGSCNDWYYMVTFFPPLYPCAYSNFASYPQFTYTLSAVTVNYLTTTPQKAHSMAIWVKYK